MEWAFLLLGSVFGAVPWAMGYWVWKRAHGWAEVGEPTAALVLGCPPRGPKALPNRLFLARLQAVQRAISEDQLKSVLLSGTPQEVDAMREYLEGNPQCPDLLLDRSSYRTLDSLLRARDAFGGRPFFVVSQKFHLQRALWLGECLKLRVIPLVAEGDGLSTRLWLRECLARWRMLWDAMRLR